MSNLVPLLFPILGNLLGLYLVIGQRRKAFPTILLANVATSVLFGIFVSVQVACCSADPAWWLMPLFLAPLEYWFKFGFLIILLAWFMTAWSKKRDGRRPA